MQLGSRRRSERDGLGRAHLPQPGVDEETAGLAAHELHVGGGHPRQRGQAAAGLLDARLHAFFRLGQTVPRSKPQGIAHRRFGDGAAPVQVYDADGWKALVLASEGQDQHEGRAAQATSTRVNIPAATHSRNQRKS